MVHNLGRLVVIGAGLYAARRYFRNWGTTKEESRAALPGDELVGQPAVQTLQTSRWSSCADRERAMSAVSLLEQAGHQHIVVPDGGPQDWVHATGGTLQTGP